ncbi:hypothetical protein H4582DRAFT_2074017 [Lactarius indigo]|nr:hypothetical protein H4582DRAFT_2074017 [Lactarius indigo]
MSHRSCNRYSKGPQSKRNIAASKIPEVPTGTDSTTQPPATTEPTEPSVGLDEGAQASATLLKLLQVSELLAWFSNNKLSAPKWKRKDAWADLVDAIVKSPELAHISKSTVKEIIEKHKAKKGPPKPLAADSFEIRIPGLYIAKFSPILGALIRDAFNSTIPANAEASLPAVQLPESGTTLIGLSFIFPLVPTPPPTLAIEATMELLSAAQKYETHHSIHDDNAFRAYSLAQKYELRQEAVNAAQLILNLFFIIRVLEEKFGIMLDLRGFRDSGASSMLKGLECISRASSGIPNWLDYFISFCRISFRPGFRRIPEGMGATPQWEHPLPALWPHVTAPYGQL